VQHHFGTKSGLRDAVNAHVATLVGDAFADAGENRTEDPIADLGLRITAVVRGHPEVVQYVGRALLEGDEATEDLFASFVDLAAGQLGRLDERGLLNPDRDQVWAALHPVVWSLGSVLLKDAIDRRLPEPLLTPAGLERWNEASTALFRHGVEAPPGGGKRRGG
jgi:hypothetical protein